MRKRKQQTKLSVSTAHRKALLRNLSQELIQHGQIRTTLAKARALRPFVESLITKARRSGPAAKRLIAPAFYLPEVAEKLVSEIGPRFAKRAGGYTRIIKLGPRKGDGAEEAIVQLVE